MLRKLLSLTVTLTLVLTISGCYRIPVDQGNEITAKMISKIYPGVSKDRVISIVGNPVLTNTFANNQIAYVYTYREGNRTEALKQLIVTFKGNTVIKVSSEGINAHAASPPS